MGSHWPSLPPFPGPGARSSQAPGDTPISSQRSLMFTNSARLLPLATKRTSPERTCRHSGFWFFMGGVFFHLRRIPLRERKGIFSSRGLSLQWVHAYSPKVEEDCLKDAEWQEKNVTSTSLRQARRGLAQSQGRRFRQGQAWLPSCEPEPVCWRRRMVGSLGVLLQGLS